MSFVADTYKTDHLKIDTSKLDFVFESILNQLENHKINYIHLDRQNYQLAWNLQKKIHQMVKENKIPDVVLFLEHENVYTFGKNADRDFLLNSHPKADVIQTQTSIHPGNSGGPLLNDDKNDKSSNGKSAFLHMDFAKDFSNSNVATGRHSTSLSVLEIKTVWQKPMKMCAMLSWQ